MQTVDPGTAVERALLDREEEVTRLTASLENERKNRAQDESESKRHALELQQQVANAYKDAEQARMAATAASADHELSLRQARSDEQRALDSVKAAKVRYSDFIFKRQSFLSGNFDPEKDNFL